MSYLVANPEDRFSRDETHLMSNSSFQDRILHDLSVGKFFSIDEQHWQKS